MKQRDVSALLDYLQESVGDGLRSVITYDFDGQEYEVVFAREGVLDDYTEQTVKNIVRTYETDSLSKVGQERWYPHGDQQCVIRCFEKGVEMNLLDDGEGVAIGMDRGTFVGQQSFVGNCLEVSGLVEEES